MSGMLDKKTTAASAASAPRETVRRIDWDQCTIVPGEQLAAAIPSVKIDKSSQTMDSVTTPDGAMVVQALLAKVRFDEKVPLYVASIEGALMHVSKGYIALAKACETATASLHNPGGNALPHGLLAVIAEVNLVRASITLEEKIRINGQIRHYRSRHFPVLDDQGAIVAVGGTYVDCTKEIEELEQANAAQARFRDFARASSDWFWETDRTGNFTMLSDRLTALLGVPTALLLGRGFADLGVMQTTLDGELPMRNAINHNRPFRDQLFAMSSRDGDALVFHISGVPVFDSVSGDFQGYRGAGMDVTQRMKYEQQAEDIKRSLEKMLEELTNKNVQLDMASARAEEALRVKTDFLAAMSHELRTPLNAIIGFAEAMKLEVFGDLNNQYKTYSNDILNAGQHLLGLINDVLDVAVLENDKITLEPESLSIKSIVDNAFNLVIMRANKKQLDTRAVELSDDWMIYADMRRLTQVFVNLFSNAVKFTLERGSIGVDASLQDNGMLAVTVWDTGIGIPKDKHAAVFEKFQQCVDNIYSRREEGTGLGLHISKHLAQLMGGDITLESQEGVGSRFTVTLPLDRRRKR